MIGNDVIDLRDPEAQPDARHPRFDRRVFARQERQALARSGAPARLRWILWAAKEAAYKVARKLDGSVVFSPPLFVVSLDADLRGTVAHEGTRFDVSVEESPECVHALASDASSSGGRRVARVARLADGADPSAAARTLAVEDVASLIGASPDDLEVEKEGRVPILLAHGERSGIDLSLSHHGRFVAFACELDADRVGQP
jgi:holo-[acyl-carrier protein] synthase